MLTMTAQVITGFLSTVSAICPYSNKTLKLSTASSKSYSFHVLP